MFNRYSVISLFFVLASSANAAEQLSTPRNVRLAAEKNLTACISAAVKQKPTGNQLLSDGLTSCYSGTRPILTDNIERAAQKIVQSKDANCQKLYSEFEEKWATYQESIVNLPSLSEMPLNTDDDLELVLLEHKYDLAYSVANNSACLN